MNIILRNRLYLETIMAQQIKIYVIPVDLFYLTILHSFSKSHVIRDFHYFNRWQDYCILIYLLFVCVYNMTLYYEYNIQNARCCKKKYNKHVIYWGI